MKFHSMRCWIVALPLIFTAEYGRCGLAGTDLQAFHSSGGSGSGGGGGGSNRPHLTPEQTTAYNYNAQGNAAVNRGDWATAIADYQNALQSTPNDPVIRRNLGNAQNNRGVIFYNKGDWAAAFIDFKSASQNEPDAQVVRDNLNAAETKLKEQQEEFQKEQAEAERQRQNKIASGNIQQNIQNFADTLKNSPVASGGLDFDSGKPGNPPPSGGGGNGLDFNLPTSTTTTTKPAAGLDYVEPPVVDARGPKDLPKDLDKAIAGTFSDAPAGVQDRVDKAFQAVMKKDWAVAKAWFGDALNHDPDNALLKKWVALCDETKTSSSPSAKNDATPDKKTDKENNEELDKLLSELIRQSIINK